MISPSTADRDRNDKASASIAVGKILLKMSSISKSFAGVRVVKDVSIEVRAGEIHGLVGENGAGKSTLMKVLAGVHEPDAGLIVWNGQTPGRWRGPADAIRHGIELIPQEASFIPSLSIAENMLVGAYPNVAGMVSWKRLRKQASDIASRVGLQVELDMPAGLLTAAEQRLLMVGRALVRRVSLLIMDEPTVALSRPEVDKVMALMRELRSRGVSIIFVSHRLAEVEELCNRVTIMKDGEVVACREIGAVDRRSLIELIVGRELAAEFVRPHGSIEGPDVLVLRNLSGPGIQDASLTVRRGEILGLAGLVGSGRTELARLIFGADKRISGEMTLNGRPVAFRNPRDAIKAGVALVHENRHKYGIIPYMSVRSNISLARLRAFSRLGLMEGHRESAAVTKLAERLGIAAHSIRMPVIALSGGNQQKVLVARWLISNASVFIFDEPTEGVDVGAKEDMFAIINDLAAAGAAVIVISSEFEELVRICNRVVVLRERRVIGELSQPDISESRLLDMCYRD
jgi:ribose transport system ATP-binding protein